MANEWPSNQRRQDAALSKKMQCLGTVLVAVWTDQSASMFWSGKKHDQSSDGQHNSSMTGVRVHCQRLCGFSMSDCFLWKQQQFQQIKQSTLSLQH